MVLNIDFSSSLSFNRIKLKKKSTKGLKQYNYYKHAFAWKLKFSNKKKRNIYEQSEKI